MTSIRELRRQYHRELCQQVIFIKAGNKPSMADVSSRQSVEIARALIGQLGYSTSSEAIDGQTAGQRLEQITKSFLERTFKQLAHLRPGKWSFSVHGNISDFDQIVARIPLADAEINRNATMIEDAELPKYTPLRARNSSALTLHASVSCKWIIRSDRSQNARTEGLNLIRNRKGHTPHIAIITGEPLPNRIASVAMGTGDIDCVYHFALPDLPFDLAI